MKKKLKKRDWLNPLSSYDNGYIMIDFSTDDYKYGKKKKKKFMDGTISIADCNRITHLNFYADNEKDRKESLKKVTLIRDRMNEVVEFLEQAEL